MGLCTIHVLLSTFFTVGCFEINTDEQRLVESLFGNYNKKLRPVTNTVDVISVTLKPALFSIVRTDEAAESITVVLWLDMKWNDIFLRWNASEYGGMKQLRIPISDIWYPDIFIENTINVQATIPEEKNYAAIDNDGSILISKVQVLTLHCEYHISMFPFDIQNCTMNIASWQHTSDIMDIFYHNSTDSSPYNENSEWNLISTKTRKSTAYYGELIGWWDKVHYDIIIQRKPSYYLFTFVLPCFMITTISIIGIFAPFNDAGDREEKVTLGLTTLLTMVVYVTLIADQMPKSSKGMPLLGTYILLLFGTTAITSLMAVIIMYQSRKWIFGEPVPDWILTVTRLNSKENTILEQNATIAFNSSYYRITDEVNNNASSGFVNANKQQQTISLKNIQSMVGQIVEYLNEQRNEDNLRQEWQRATERLDLLLMIVFLAFHFTLTAAVLIIGYSYLLK